MVKVFVVDGYGVKIYVKNRAVVIKGYGDSSKKVVPLAEIDRIVFASSGISITTSAIRRIAREGIDILVLDGRGMPITMMTPPWITATVATRRAQYIAYIDNEYRVSIMKSFAISKISNQLNYLKSISKRIGVKVSQSDIESIAEKMEKIKSLSGDPSEVRQRILSFEGASAEIYWGYIASALPRELKFDGRDQDGSDQVNLALNYLYGVLYAEVFRVLARYGLDPYAGYLHVDRSGAETLVFDFIEMFRVSAVDSLVVELFRNGLRISVRDDGYIETSSRRRLVEEVYRWIQRRARDQRNEVKKLSDHMKSYALEFTRALRSKAIYTGFVEVWP